MTEDTSGAPAAGTPEPAWRNWAPGLRVVVRYTGDDGGLTDALGTVTANSPEALTIERKAGPVAVPHAAIVLGHEVPPAPERRGSPASALSPADLQSVLAEAWRPAEATWLHARNLSAEIADADGDDETPVLEKGWLLRAAGGHTKRANSALAIGDPGMGPGPTIEAVERWYSDRSLTPAVTVFGVAGSRHPADGPLAAAGWRVVEPSIVLTAATIEVGGGPGRARGDAGGVSVELADAPSEDFYRGLGHPDPATRPAALERLLLSAPSQLFALARDGDGGLLGVARLAIVRRWAVLTGLEIDPAARRRGLGTVMTRTLAAAASRQGIRSMALQVVAANEGALALYERLGFTEHHRYHYRLRSAGAGAEPRAAIR